MWGTAVDRLSYLVLTLLMITVILLTAYDPASSSTTSHQPPWMAVSWTLD